MSPLYLHNNKLLVVDGALAASENCCCGSSSSSSSSSSSEGGSPCPDCYRVDIEWIVQNCESGNPKTFIGSLLFDGGGIFCYNGEVTDADFTYAWFGVACDDESVTNLYIAFVCSNMGTTIVTSYPNGNGFFTLDGNLCCGEEIGYYNFNDDYESLTLTISLANYGNCNCSGYTPV